MNAPLVSVLGWTLLHSLWEGTLGVLATAMVLRMLRGASPRARYGVAVAGLLLVAGLPLRHLGTSPSSVPASVTQGSIGQGGRLLLGRNPVPSGAKPDPALALRTRMAERLEQTVHRMEWALPWMVGAWALGAVISLLRLAGGWMMLQRLRWRKAELASDALQRQLLDLCRRTGLKRAVTLLTCEGLTGPSVVGALRPAILVPAGWFLNLPPSHVEALLAHELAHVLRHDYLVNLLQSLLEVLMFYHPGVWWLSRRIRAERELAADAFAARLLGDPLPLAEALTDLERRGLAALAIPAPAAHGGSLMERIASLLLPRPRTSSAPLFGALALVGLLLAGGLSLRAQAPDPTPAVAPVIPQKADTPEAHFWLEIRPSQGGIGHRISMKADQVPLDQAWSWIHLNPVFSQPDMGMTTAQPRWTQAKPRLLDGGSAYLEDTVGPRVNLDLKDVSLGEVTALFQRLAKAHGTRTYPSVNGVWPSSWVKIRHQADGKVALDLQVERVSPGLLEKLMAHATTLAREYPADVMTGLDRDEDCYPGPRIFMSSQGTVEDLTQQVARVVAEARKVR